jgi:hypothetical protein
MKNATHRALEVMKLAFEDMHHDPEKALSELRPLYHDDVAFTDPLQALAGWDAFADMSRRLCARARKVRFHVLQMAGDGDEGFMTWTLAIEMPRRPAVKIEGTTHVTLRDGRVARQRDYWDLLGSLMASLPGGRMVKRVVARLA